MGTSVAEKGVGRAASGLNHVMCVICEFHSLAPNETILKSPKLANIIKV